MINWQAIIKMYRARHHPDHEKEREWFAQRPTVKSAIECAALATHKDGKRYTHQRRIPKSVLDNARGELLNLESTICQCKNFDDLLRTIENAISEIHGIGELYIDDTALRIGCWLKIYPDRVYLHCGVRDGARHLGIDGKRRDLELNELPEPLRSLPATEIEDILCIFKDKFN